ncbi:VOC family protein [Streptomyces sp. NPDC096153]|uniref:VOC family protein n=1 Tax=Streptomyces sp. NPDC096153 TaxID=3155548 RepID=UPI003327AC26
MLRGLTTVSFRAADLDAAAKWYTELLGVAPYFERPGCIEFRLGDHEHELGIIDSRFAPQDHAPGAGGAVVHWHVDDLEGALDRLLPLGSEEHQAPTEHGEGFVTASAWTRSGASSASWTTGTASTSCGRASPVPEPRRGTPVP